MKIVFLCGSLEPGFDGVGDYTRRLGGELIRQGHEASAIALNDPHISRQFTGTQCAEGINFPVLRLPSTGTSKDRLNAAKKWIVAYDPLWLSLQFVPFSFHPKGLPFSLSKFLSEIGTGRRWQVMFHELWVGMDNDSTKNYILWGKLQRYIIKSLLVKLRVRVIHTQSKLYLVQLSKLGFTAEHLPLFSNIPVNFQACNILDKDCKDYNDNTPKRIRLVNFGAIHPHSLLHELITEAKLYAVKSNMPISLIIIGRAGKERSKWIAAWKAAGIGVELFEDQSPERISEMLTSGSIGISTCPHAIIDKSGTATAMLEHGLPVLCVAKSWNPIGINFSIDFHGVFILGKDSFETCISQRPFFVPTTTLSGISKTFITSLQKL